MYLAAGIVFLVTEVAVVGGIIGTAVAATKKRGELTVSKKNLLYLVPTTLLIYLLHLAAALYNGEPMDFFSVFSLVGATVEVVTEFTADSARLLPLCRAYPIFYVDFVLAYLAGAGTIILGVTSFFGQRIANASGVSRRLRNNCDVVVGDSPDAVRYVKQNENSILLVESVSRQRYGDLLKEGVPVVRSPLAEFGERLASGRYNLIVFREESAPCADVVDEFVNLRRRGCAVTLNLQVSPAEAKIVKEKFIAKADREVAASFNCFGKHELIARQFVADYPITKFLGPEFYNDNFTVKDDYRINVVFVGFGKMNYQLFRTCATQFQFAAQQGDRLVAKPVKYYVYDNNDSALHNEFFSQIFYEYEENFKDCDFPKPERICDVEVNRCDINSVEAKSRFRELVSPKSFTYFIVSLNTDLEDASYARTVRRMLADEENYRIFVRAKNSAAKLNAPDDPIIYFGEDDVLYSHDAIVNDDLFLLAQRINLLYNSIADSPQWLESIRNLPAAEQNGALLASLQDEKNRVLMREQWEARPAIEQTSNLHHALNLPFKFNMLGFEMVKRDRDDDAGVSEDEFDEKYVNTGRRDGYKDTSFFFGTQSSNVLAFVEHSRWNALYMLNDYRQMKKADITLKEEVAADGSVSRDAPHKDHERRLHACLTTYYGLKELIDYKFSLLYPDADVSAVPSDDPRLGELCKIYRYDYMDLDRMYAEITAMGYKLVKKQPVGR